MVAWDAKTVPIGDEAGSAAPGLPHYSTNTSSSSLLLPSPKPKWYMTVDWSTIGYWMFLAGSILYIAQASIPYYTPAPSSSATASDGTTDDAAADYYDLDDGYEGPYYSKNATGWEGLWAGIIFEIESSIYIFGWLVARESERQHNKTPMIWWKDWNFHGNLWFFLGSTGYLIVAIWALESSHPYESAVGLIAMSFVFLFDSVFYFMALLGGSHSRSGRPHGTHAAHNYTLESSVDFYFFASLLFILGSIVYIIASLQAYQGKNSDAMNMLGAAVFVVDSILYLLSGRQSRDEEDEMPIVERAKSRKSIHLTHRKSLSAGL